jgi:hypothetical protein
MLKQFTDWLWSLVVAVFGAMWDFVQDAVVAVLDGLVGAFVYIVSIIPVPAWLSGGLGGVWSGMDGGIIWVATQCGVPQAMAIIGAGYAFRLTRKFFTLFQW